MSAHVFACEISQHLFTSMHHFDEPRQVLVLRNNTPKSTKQSSPLSHRNLKRQAEPATPLQNPRFARKRTLIAEPSWAQVLAILEPESTSESEVYRRQIQELEEVIEFANLERQFA